jgi:hypothetical protein
VVACRAVRLGANREPCPAKPLGFTHPRKPGVPPCFALGTAGLVNYGKTFVDPIRFWLKVNITSDHWIWEAAKSRAGYGYVWDNGRTVSAHRVAWEMSHGPIPEGMHLHHKCGVPLCFRPDHLVTVSASEHVYVHRPESIFQCLRGHPYDQGNTYITTSGTKACRACNAASKRRAYHRASV